MALKLKKKIFNFIQDSPQQCTPRVINELIEPVRTKLIDDLISIKNMFARFNSKTMKSFPP